MTKVDKANINILSSIKEYLILRFFEMSGLRT